MALGPLDEEEKEVDEALHDREVEARLLALDPGIVHVPHAREHIFNR